MDAPAAARTRPTRREDLVERAWELASSPRLAAGLALALAAAGAAGLLLGPAEAGSAGAGQAAASGWSRALDALVVADDPFHSWWFTLLLVMLALSAVALGLERLPLAAAVLRPARRLTAQVERGLRRVRRLEAGSDAGAEAGRVAAAFRARGFEPKTVEAGGTRYLFAERGRRARFGEWVAYAGLMALLGIGIAGRVIEWEGTMEVRQGEATDEVARRAAGGFLERRRLPFAVRLDRFAVDRSRAGAPATVRAEVSLLGPGGREMGRRDLDASRPLRQEGFDLYQAGWRELPGAVAALALVDRQERVRRTVRLGPREPFQAGRATFSVEEYSPSFQGLGPAVRVRRTEDDRSTDSWVPQGAAQDVSDRWSLEFQGLEKSYVAALRVAYRPLLEGLVAGAALLLLGLAAAVSCTHRRLWARVEPGAIVLAGASHRSSPGFEKALDEIGRGLAAPAARA
jgi:cytochrome c biogenesis protein